MTCTVRIASPLRSHTSGLHSVRVSGGTLGEIVDELDRHHPGTRLRLIDEHDSIRGHIRLFINGRSAAALSAPVAAGDVVDVLCALSGG